MADRPQVGRHPVEDEARREARHDREEHERQHHHDRALRLVHRRAHEVRRRDLRARVDHQEDVTRPVRDRVLVGDVYDVQPRARDVVRLVAQREVQRGLAAGRDDDFFRRVRRAVRVLKVLGNGLPQFDDAGRAGVLGEPLLDGLDRRPLDDLRRVEVRLARGEADDVDPLAPQLAGAVVHADRHRGRDRANA